MRAFLESVEELTNCPPPAELSFRWSMAIDKSCIVSANSTRLWKSRGPSNITRPEIPRSTERTHAHDARLLQHQGLKRVLSERSLSLGVGEAREGERQPETHTRRAGRFMMRTSVSVFQWRSCLKSKVAPNQRSQGKRLREM